MKNVTQKSTQKSCTSYIKYLHNFFIYIVTSKKFCQIKLAWVLVILVYHLIISMHTVQSYWGLKPQNGQGPFFKLPINICIYAHLKSNQTNLFMFCFVFLSYFSESVLQELSERGVAVVPNVLTPTECDHYVAQYKSWLDKFSSMGVELNSTKSLIGSYRVAHFDVTWEVRLKTKPVFEKLWKTEKLLTSADAIAVSRPPEEGNVIL